MKIKEACNKTGLTERTIRFYIEKGLICPASYELNDRVYHEYSDNDIRRLEKIITFRKIGFSVDAIADMQANPGHIDALLSDHIAAIRFREKDFSLMLTILEKIEGKHFTDSDALAESLRGKVSDMALPPMDVMDFSRFDSETREEREGGYLDFLIQQRIHQIISVVSKPFKIILKVLLAASAVLLLVYALSCIPKGISKQFTAIDFKAGEAGTGSTVSVSIHGKLYRRLFEEPIYVGQIELDSVSYSSNSTVTVHFYDGIEKPAWLVYHGLKTQGNETSPFMNSFAMVWTDSNFDYIVFNCFEDGTQKNRLICAPAANPAEAMKLLADIKPLAELLQQINQYK